MKNRELLLAIIAVMFGVGVSHGEMLQCEPNQIKGLIGTKNPELKYYLIPSHRLYPNIINLDQLRGEQCFNTEEEAQKAGFAKVPMSVVTQTEVTPTRERQPQQPRAGTSNGLGISYGQAIQTLGDFFAIKPSTPVNGQPRAMGMSNNQLATLEIIGNPQNISKASLLLGVPNDDSQALQQNALFALQLVQNVVPEWGWPENETWIAESIQSLSGEPQGERSITKAGKIVKISWLSSIAVFSLSISRE